MLGGLKSNAYPPFRAGEFVYVYHYFGAGYYNAYSDNIPESGYGVIVDTPYNGVGPEYLVESSLIGVLIKGKINWYAPNEIHRLQPGNVSSNA